ncbi:MULTISPECIES: VOC family protein [Streptomyces]|uniref:VOC family protein n=1 Tax=Streptomyces katrae TaxID=68223 RepID=A0ABT7GTS8_9ACTN|nr:MULTISPECIES: VOC family protein [Streptomyces]MDK9496641.1 VOC family protein [Streptomyces katrae]RST07504.1 VOC family protein [Streptomyces sp. WAC07149]GLX18814.1 hydroxylase [Streptomyces lavendulae subsp. lavendulae]GLX29264.1 hydroxylase [Streptomyces lavendulae subsp. lavendulae]
MLGTAFRTGSPNWLDLGSPDTAAAAAFYGSVFGWEFVSAGPDAGGYGFFRLGGKTVAALGPLTEKGATSAWMVHFQSADMQATAEKVRAGGGTVRMEPMDVMGEGWLAQFTDPQGAQFASWQPGKTGGLEVASEVNTLVWVELHVPDPVAAIRFYAGVFGWRYIEMETPGMTYRVLSIGEGDQEEGSFGGVAPQGEGAGGASTMVPRWVPYFHVADVDATVTAVEGNGGAVLMPATDVPDVGRIAWASDPAGAVFALLKPSPRA